MAGPRMAKTIAVIPAYNEARTVRQIADAVRLFVDGVIVIDDGSTDGTSDMLADLDIKVVRHTVNVGKGCRLVEGLNLAFREGATRVITLDADGQHNPADIPAFLARSAENPTAIILGDRSAQMERIPLMRATAIRFGNFFISWACVVRIGDAQCGMRVYPADMWKKVCIPPGEIDRFLFETAVLLYSAEAGIPFAFVPIDARYAGFVQRPSHFEPVHDFLDLGRLVIRFLFSRRLRPRGFLFALDL